MPKAKLSPEEQLKRKLERRAAKKAKRLTIKNAVAAVEAPATKSKKSKNPFHLIEISEKDSEGMKRIAELREAGAPIRQIAYASPYFVFEVPSSITEYPKHGTGAGNIDKSVPALKPLKTIADLITKVEVDKADGAKLNKRYIKLLVRGSELKRNIKREAVDTLIKQFKIK